MKTIRQTLSPETRINWLALNEKTSRKAQKQQKIFKRNPEKRPYSIRLKPRCEKFTENKYFPMYIIPRNN